MRTILNSMIDYLNLREGYAKAIFSYYLEKVNIDELQKAIDNVCDEMAKDFIIKFKEDLKLQTVEQELRKYLLNNQVDKKHTGKRVHEAVYENLNKLKNEKTLD